MDLYMFWEALQKPMPWPALGIMIAAMMVCQFIAIFKWKIRGMANYFLGVMILAVMFVLFTAVQVIKFQM